jgi:hypothetical protein
MLFIIATYCSNNTACFNVNSDKICQGKIVAEDQKNPVYTYYRLISAKKVILGEYHGSCNEKAISKSLMNISQDVELAMGL